MTHKNSPGHFAQSTTEAGGTACSPATSSLNLPRSAPINTGKRAGAFLDGSEAVINAAIGLIISLLLTWLWLGFSPVQSVGITAVFFCASTARAYAIRRLFRWLS